MLADEHNRQKPADDNEQDDYWKKKLELEKKGIKKFNQKVFHAWCKACGICIAFCPKKVLGRDEQGKPVVELPDHCIGCRFCEMHCPDFAVSISERYPDRRKKRDEA